jgi:hypothetical protein
MSDKLATYLAAKGIDHDTVDEVIERAANLELNGVERWKAGITAQVQILGQVEVQAHDI